VSQFVDEDPVKIALPKKGRNEDSEDLSGLDPSLSINLEQRRKRKDSTGPSEAKRSTKVEVQLGVREAAGSLKAGAKRKLSVRDDDEHEAPVQPRSPDDFKFTRVASEDRTKSTQVPSDKSGSRVSSCQGSCSREAVLNYGTNEQEGLGAEERQRLAPKNRKGFGAGRDKSF
jgi:hypothetical protein